MFRDRHETRQTASVVSSWNHFLFHSLQVFHSIPDNSIIKMRLLILLALPFLTLAAPLPEDLEDLKQTPSSINALKNLFTGEVKVPVNTVLNPGLAAIGADPMPVPMEELEPQDLAMMLLLNHKEPEIIPEQKDIIKEKSVASLKPLTIKTLVPPTPK